MRRAGIVVLAALGCGAPATDESGPCTCVPNAPPAKVSASLMTLLRRHQQAVRDGHRNGRDTKLIDDELRMQSAIVCEPCGAWVGERATAEELYPLARLDEASAVACTALRLRDGTLAFGDARPASCRTR